METQTETVETETPDVEPVEATTEVETTPVETPAAVDRPPSDRKNRKAQRLDVEAAERRAQEFQRSLETERQERQRIEREVAEMRQERQQRDRQTQSQSQAEQTKEKIASLRRVAQMHLARSAQLQGAEAQKAWDEFQRCEDEARDLRDEMRDNERWEKRKGELQQQMPNPQATQALAGHETAYPWLTTNQEAVNMADTRLTYLMNAGRPLNRQTVVEALSWTARAMGLGGHQPATDAQRARYGGIPGGEGAGNGEGPRTIKMGRHEEALAKAAYPQLEAKQAYKQWAKDVAARQSGDDD